MKVRGRSRRQRGRSKVKEGGTESGNTKTQGYWILEEGSEETEGVMGIRQA